MSAKKKTPIAKKKQSAVKPTTKKKSVIKKPKPTKPDSKVSINRKSVVVSPAKEESHG